MRRCDYMLDIETLGTAIDSVVLQIAIVEFNIDDGKVISGKEFHISLNQQKQQGRVTYFDALRFWLKENPSLLKELIDASTPEFLTIDSVKHEFLNYIKDANYNSGLNYNPPISVNIWCRGSDFDFAIIRNLFGEDFINSNNLIKYNSGRDTRTVIDLAELLYPGLVKPERPATLPKHNAMADCKYQILELVNAIDHIKTPSCFNVC